MPPSPPRGQSWPKAQRADEVSGQPDLRDGLIMLRPVGDLWGSESLPDCSGLSCPCQRPHMCLISVHRCYPVLALAGTRGTCRMSLFPLPPSHTHSFPSWAPLPPPSDSQGSAGAPLPGRPLHWDRGDARVTSPGSGVSLGGRRDP